MQVGSSGRLNAELNVTPMIDVVLVLLIIFMVVTPKNERELPALIPKEAPVEAEPPPPDQEPVVLSVNETGELAVNGEACATLQEVQEKVRAALTSHAEKVVFLEAQDDAPYERAVHAMDAARQGGAKHVGMLRRPEKQQ